MNSPFSVLLLIAGLFVGLLVVKSITRWRFCVICTSISVTWVALLVLYWLGLFDQPVIIAVLMGQSIVGLYYFIEKATDEVFHIFRLPLLLTLTLGALVALDVTTDLTVSLGLIATVWSAMLFLYSYRRNPRMKIVVDRVIACCKDW
ncbi:MAG: hypothetical protein GTO41_23720 [Burkholderiales bacterium]|nr:hypothetical protein [Burkholderiales bacterium]